MDTVEAMKQRRSIRAFKPDPVPRETLRRILELATLAPSWSNTQPWELVAVTGDKLKEIRDEFVARSDEELTPDIARPREFPEPYNTRLRAQAANQLEIKGIRREDKAGRTSWRMDGLRHFGAPCVIYICIEREFYFQADGINVWPIFDCGLIAENIMLLAANYGLGTVPQAQAVVYPDVVRRVLGLPGSKLIVLCIPVGYPDTGASINKFERNREPLDKVSKWYGFD